MSAAQQLEYWEGVARDAQEYGERAMRRYALGRARRWRTLVKLAQLKRKLKLERLRRRALQRRLESTIQEYESILDAL